MTYVPAGDPERLFGDSTAMRAFLHAVAESAAGAARGEAPVDTGRYRRSIVGQVETTSAGTVATAGSDDFKWHWLEFGTGGSSPTPAFRPLTKALNRARRL